MATPHLAGIAAVVRGQHPAWTAAQVRSAIVNTGRSGCAEGLERQSARPSLNVNQHRLRPGQCASAATLQVALDPVSVSFGCRAGRLGTVVVEFGHAEQPARRCGPDTAATVTDGPRSPPAAASRCGDGLGEQPIRVDDDRRRRVPRQVAARDDPPRFEAAARRSRTPRSTCSSSSASARRSRQTREAALGRPFCVGFPRANRA